MEKTNDHSQRGHDNFGPSQHKALDECPGYEGTVGTSEAAERGTRIHEALEVRDPSALLCMEEVEIYEVCVEQEDVLIGAFTQGQPYQRYNELPLDIELNAGLKTWGTADVIIICGTRALIIDYKTGIMKVEEAISNDQARAYTIGVFDKFGVEEVTFAFIAPQVSEEPDVATFVRDDIDFLRQQTTVIVGKAQEVRAKWRTGTPDADELNPCDYCTWCRYQTICPALHGLMYDFGERAQTDFDLPPQVDPDSDDADELAKLHTVAKILEPVIDNIKKKAVELALEGEVLPGWKLQSLGSKTISIDNHALLEYADQHGITIDQIIEMVNIPVAKIRKEVGKKAPKGHQKKVEKQFEEEGIAEGIFQKAKERHCLRKEKTK